MVRSKLTELRQEANKYIGIPYFMNVSKKYHPELVMVGKGSAKEIALKTIEFANLENKKIMDMTPQEIYNFQKKHRLGIDCSGLSVHLLNFYLGTRFNPRKTSANILTSTPLSKKINISDADTADLIRQEKGGHVIFIIEKIGDKVIYIESSRSGRKVHYGEFDIHDKSFKYNGIYRITSPQSIPDILMD